MHGLSNEAVFRLQLDVIRLNKENRELKKRLGLPLDGRAVRLSVDNESETVNTPVNTVNDVNTDVNTAETAETDRKAYMRDYMRQQRAALKNNNPTA